MSLVADGFRCKRCDGSIQEANLVDDLVVDEEPYGCVEFVILEDTLDRDGGADHAATARIRNEWIKFPGMNGQVYANCVRSSMTYGSETRPLLADVGSKFARSDMQIII